MYYPVPIHLQGALADLGCQPGDLPVTERVGSYVLSLPMYPELTDAEIAYVADNMAAFFA